MATLTYPLLRAYGYTDGPRALERQRARLLAAVACAGGGRGGR